MSIVERPPPDPRKLLETWQEWERGETPPGKVISDLKNRGLPDLLRSLVEGGAVGGPPS